MAKIGPLRAFWGIGAPGSGKHQLESVWPVHGSVLVRDGVLYCVAGRSMFLDGGMRFLRLDARTGEKLSETVLDERHPQTGEHLQADLKWPNLPTGLPDVLSSDGRYVYMRAQRFDLMGKRPEVVAPTEYTDQTGEGAHLFCPTGFLDDAGWHRTYWLFGKSFIGGAGGWHLACLRAPAGRIMVFDESSIYGFGRTPERLRGSPFAYHLFATEKQPEFAPIDPRAKPEGRGRFGGIIRTKPEYRWSEPVPLLARAMALAGETLFIAGPPDVLDEADAYQRISDADIQAKLAGQAAAFQGRKGGLLWAVSASDGRKLAEYALDAPPAWDGMAAARGRLYIATLDGRVLCMGRGT
jgi:hypothetical protein